MSEIGEFLENPTISKITRQEKNQYQLSHIDVMDLFRKIEILEKQTKEYEKDKKSITALKRESSANKKEIKLLTAKCTNLEQQIENKIKSEVALKQEIIANKNEINKLKATCTELEKRIEKYEGDKQFTSELVQKTTISVKEQKKTVRIGEIIKFGRYERKDIEWQVLAVNQKDNSVLLISKYLLFRKAYNYKKEACTWETSTLRHYLNNEFYRDTFNEKEKKKIKEEIVKNPDNERWQTEGGNNTQDKVFLLSIDEAKQYFKTNEDRKTALIGEESSWFYWLRSPGYDCHSAAYVQYGNVDESGGNVGNGSMCVRPALWVNL